MLDPTAIVALFGGNLLINRLVNAAERGQAALIMPTTAIADAESEVRAGTSGWEAVL